MSTRSGTRWSTRSRSRWGAVAGALLRCARRRRGERGAATVFVVSMTVVLLVTAGLVIDGGQALNGRARVADDAEQAARAAADQIDVPALRGTGEIVIRADAGAAAAAGLLAVRGYGPDQYSVSVAGDSAAVTVTDTVPTAFLLLLGIAQFPVQAAATAQAVTAAG